MEVGYKVFRADILRRISLESDPFGFESEVTVKAAKLACRRAGSLEVELGYQGGASAGGAGTPNGEAGGSV